LDLEAFEDFEDFDLPDSEPLAEPFEEALEDSLPAEALPDAALPDEALPEPFAGTDLAEDFVS
jgi:hypothetical protein